MADEDFAEVTDKPRKRRIVGRKTDFEKKRRVSDHTAGEDCRCSRLKCFETVHEEERNDLLSKFNKLDSKDEQDSFLSSLIRVSNVSRRRLRKPEEEANLHEHSFMYFVRVPRDNNNNEDKDSVVEIQVCRSALCSIFGIGKHRISRISNSIASTGFPPKDMRGRHSNRPHAHDSETIEHVKSHISSFQGRKSHYSVSRTDVFYLPESLNITKMFQLFCEQNPNTRIKYETYRKVFNEHFNIKFGFPRSDTCSKCDELEAKISHLNTVLKSPETSETERETMSKEKACAVVEKALHLKKADVFYQRKTIAKQRSKAAIHEDFEAVAFDFQKNLPTPNVTSNDVYYKRQLSVYTFDIHVLSSDDVYLYTYDQTVANKGSDDVCSFLYDFFFEKLPFIVRKLELFCDNCGGQNKNWTVLRFLHWLVHVKKRFDSIKITFPIRGHSYLECDRDMVLIDQKAHVETPMEWFKLFEQSRKNPSSFNVVQVSSDMMYDFSKCLLKMYKKTCPVATRPIRELVIETGHPRIMKVRTSWNGMYETAVIRTANHCKVSDTTLSSLYTAPLPISEDKYKDLQVLKRFCSPGVHCFYDQLPFFVGRRGEKAANVDNDHDDDSDC